MHISGIESLAVILHKSYAFHTDFCPLTPVFFLLFLRRNPYFPENGSFTRNVRSCALAVAPTRLPVLESPSQPSVRKMPMKSLNRLKLFVALRPARPGAHSADGNGITQPVGQTIGFCS